MSKYIDYEYTPAVHHILPPGTDGQPKSEDAPAKMVFIADTGERRHVIAGGSEAEQLMDEVRRNNPSVHGIEEENAEASTGTAEGLSAEAPAPKKKGAKKATAAEVPAAEGGVKEA